MADSTLSNLTSLTLPSQATDLLLVGRGTARPNKVAMSDALNSAALAATTGAYGVVQLAASGGTTAGTVVQATDARLSDTRNPPDGSKGDIVVSGSGSTWTIKTNPTLSGTTSAGSINASGRVTATGTTAFPYEGQLIASNSSPSGTNSAVSQAILQAQPGYSTFVGTTGDGTTASYRTGGLGNVVAALQSYLIGDGASGMLLHSINGPTIFATQNTGSEKMRLASNGNLLIGKTSDNALGRLQVSGAITMEEVAGTGLFGFFGGSSLVYGSLASNPVVIRTNNTAALTIDTSQNATFSKDILLGTSGPSVPGTLSGRAPRQGLVSDGTGLITATSTNIGTGDFTASAWVNAASYVASVFGFNGAGGIVNCVLDFPSDTLMRVYDGAGPTAYTVTVPTRPVNKWFHATWVRSAGVVTCYLDGVSQGTVTANFDIGAINYIGSISAFNKFTGRLSGLYLYNRALSAAEVKALYETGVPAASDINSASNTSIITGDNSTFASNTGWWTLSGSATISGGSLNLSAGGSFAWRNGLLRPGSRYLVTVNITANTAVDGLAIYSGGAIVAVFTGTGTKTAEFAAGSSAPLGSFYLFQAGAGAITVDSVTLNALGAVLAPDAAQTGGGLTWYDTSGNGANITLPASGVSWNVPFNGRIQFADGTGALPSMTFSGATNTGFSRNGSGHIAISQGGNAVFTAYFSSGGVLGSASGAYLQMATSGAITLAAAGTNQSLLLSPSGTGAAVVSAGSQAASTEVGLLRIVDASNANRKLFFGIDNTVSPQGIGYIQGAVTGTTTIPLVLNPLGGSVLIGTSTDSSNGRLQLADHTAATGGIGMGTDWSFFRLNTSILRFQTASVSPGLSLRHSTSGTELTLTASTASGNGIVNTVSCNNLVLGVNGGTALTLDNAQGATFAASLRTTAGGFRSTGSLSLGVAYATLGAGFQVSYDSPDTRIFYGDGTGYSLRFATRVSSTTTDRVVINDNGNVTINGNLTVTGTISPSSGAGLTNVWIPASQWIPRTTNGCGVDSTETTTNRQNFDELLFDPAAIEYAQALVRMPSNYNNGTVTARFFWSSSSSTGSVVWALQARAFADDDALDTAFGTAQTVTDTLLATGDMHISAATSAITSGGTPAATTPLQFQIYRDATNGSDTLGSDARLLGVEISFTSV